MIIRNIAAQLKSIQGILAFRPQLPLNTDSRTLFALIGYKRDLR